jgi:hypothetical protein
LATCKLPSSTARKRYGRSSGNGAIAARTADYGLQVLSRVLSYAVEG